MNIQLHRLDDEAVEPMPDGQNTLIIVEHKEWLPEEKGEEKEKEKEEEEDEEEEETELEASFLFKKFSSGVQTDDACFVLSDSDETSRIISSV